MLRNANQEIMAVLTEQSVFFNTNYRLLTNCLVEDMDGGKILFNGLTRACFWLSNEEYRDMFDKDKADYFSILYKYYFLVPEDYPEMEIIDLVREQFKTKIDDLYLNHPNSYTILTTTKCNARCFYCYELKSKKTHMTEDTAKKIAEYICNHSYINMPVSLSWFGGEPLFNMKVIDIITRELRDKGYNFYSRFTSNGYLFDEETVVKAKNSWNTQSVQITIDGTEEVYNKAKNYIYKDGSPYKKVLHNIETLLNANIRVGIRMNVDAYNCDDLTKLLREISDRFGRNPNLTVYCYPIFEDDDYQRTEEDRKLVFEKLLDLEELIYLLGYSLHNPSPVIAAKQCMVDDGRSITISPKGELGLCEHFIDSDFWGNINSQEKDFEVFESWLKYEEPLDICSDCPLYGSCIRPSKCIEMRKCDKHYKRWKILKEKIALRNLYNTQKLK